MAKRGRKPNLYYGVTEQNIDGTTSYIVIRSPGYKHDGSDEHIIKRNNDKAFKAFEALDKFTEYLDIWHNGNAAGVVVEV
jgi:hypothetical protein